VYGKSETDKLTVLLREKPYLYQPHGHISAESSWVFTEEDFDELLNSPVHENFLNATFLLNRVIFLGISADDIGASGRLVALRDRGLSTLSHYWITSDSHIEKRDWAEANGIQQIVYPVSLGHEECICRIIDKINSFVSYDSVNKTPIVGSSSANIVPPSEELYKMDDIDQIRISLNTLIQSYKNPNGEIEYSVYKEFCKKYARSIHASYMMPSEDGEEQYWFGYRIRGVPLGGKTIGRVFSATDQAGEPVAIKILDQRRYSDELYLSAFRRGVTSLKILAKNKIDGIVPIRDAYEVPPTIVMDLENCVSLRGVIEANSLHSVVKRLIIVIRTSEIVLKAHMLPEIILHRDIRPSNILLIGYDWSAEECEAVKVIDFDLSWYKGAVGEDFVRTDRDTLGFQAPEQFEGSATKNRRSTLIDSYGLGATLFYAIASRNPPLKAAREKSWSEDVRRACSVSFQSVPEIVPFLSRTIMQATRDRTDERISVSEIKDKLTDVVSWINDRRLECTQGFIAEMICSLSAYSEYDVDAKEHVFSFSTSHGLTVSYEYDFLEDFILCRMIYEKPANVHNSRADAVLNKLKGEFNSYFESIHTEKLYFKFVGTREFQARASFRVPIATKRAEDISRVIKRISQVLTIL